MAKKPRRRHPQPPLSRGPGLEEILSRAHALEEEGKLQEAIQLLDEAPPHLQRRPELLMLRGLFLAYAGHKEEALSNLEEAQRRDLDNPLIYFFLGLLYMDLDMPAHARRALRELMEYQAFLSEGPIQEAKIEDILNALEKDLSDLGLQLGVSREEADEVEYQLELGHRMSQAGDLSAALRHLRRAASMAPRWPIPRVMEAKTLMMAGRFREAVEIGERLLAEYPDLVSVRETLVQAFVVLGNREAAEEVARPLRKRSYSSAVELETAISALGYLSDDEGIYRLYRRHRDLVDGGEIEDAMVLIVLGSAAANLGHFRTAQRLWYQAIDRGASRVYLEPFFAAISRKAPGPGIADRYPTFQFVSLVPQPAGNEFRELLIALLDHQIERKTFQKRLRALVARYPLLLQQVIQMFRETEERGLPTELLAMIGTSEAIEELCHFAFGQKKSLSERMAVLQIMADVGVIDPEQPVEIWDEVWQEWRWLKVPRWTVVEPERPLYPPQASTMLRECIQALNADNIPQAQELMAQVLSLVPDHPDLYTLAASIWQKDLAKSQEYLQKAVELDPQHVSARIHLAQLALDRGDIPEARRQLDALRDRQEFRTWEFPEYLYALAVVSLEEEDLALVRFYADAGLRWNREDDRFLQLAWLAEGSVLDSYLRVLKERSRQYMERKRTRPIRPDASLKECLERLDKESLIAMARVHSVYYVKLRKEQLVERLSEALTDPDILEVAISSLSDAEQQALQDVLGAGGILPWDEFTTRHGSDVEENQYWYYHKPKTVMGRLRMYGFLSDGTVEGQRVVLVPSELRVLLPSSLSVTPS